MTEPATARLVAVLVRRGAQDGSALVEVVWLSLILLIPLVYIL